METAEVIAHLASIRGRSAGTDAERRATIWLRDRLHKAGHPAAMQSVWVRPFWPLAHGLHVGLVIVASAVSVSYPLLGLGLGLVGLLSLVGDLSGAFFWARRLTPRRASQNLVVAPTGSTPGRVTLVITAYVDAGPAAAVYRDRWVRGEARIRRLLRGHLPSPLALAALAAGVLAAISAARLAGASGTGLAIVQLVPSVYLLLLLAVLADVALAPAAPGANANASGVAAAMSLFERLTAGAHLPSSLDVQLVLSGAGAASALGLSAFLRDRARAGWRGADVAVLAVEPCGVGRPCFFTREGPMWATRLHPGLIDCARAAAARVPGIEAQPRVSHTSGAAHAARRRGWPALAVGALDGHDRPGRARQALDTADRVDPASVRRCVQLCLETVAELDASLARSVTPA